MAVKHHSKYVVKHVLFGRTDLERIRGSINSRLIATCFSPVRRPLSIVYRTVCHVLILLYQCFVNSWSVVMQNMVSSQTVVYYAMHCSRTVIF